MPVIGLTGNLGIYSLKSTPGDPNVQLGQEMTTKSDGLHSLKYVSVFLY